MSFLRKRVRQVGGGFGETLRELREQRGYTREDLARVSGIHSSMIRLFEEERLDEITDPMYAERHVRALVHLLEGQESHFFAKYQEALKTKNLLKPQAAILRPRVRKRDLFVISRAVAFGGFVALIVAIGAYLVWQVRSLSSKPQLEVMFPVDGQHLSLPQVQIVGTTDVGTLVQVNGVSVVVDASGTFHTALDVSSGVTVLRIEARRRYGTAASIERRVIYDRPSFSPIFGPPVPASSTSSSR